MTPSLSIVTPSFNQGKFLPRCLASVRDQPPGVAEHIVIDGASNDGSAALLQSVSSTLAFWRSEPDGGQSDAINRGFEHASAAFGGWLNADDWYQPGVLRHVTAFLADHPETDLLVCRCRFVAEDGRVVHAPIPPERIDEPSLLLLGSQWFAGHSIAQPEAFFRLALFREIGGLRTENHHSMDHELWLRLLEAGARVRQLDLYVANLSVHPQQKTADRLATTRSIITHSRAWLDRRGMLWPRHEPEVRAEIDTLESKLTMASRYVRVLDRALVTENKADGDRGPNSPLPSPPPPSTDVEIPAMRPTPKGWIEACRACFARASPDLAEAVVVCELAARDALLQVVNERWPALPVRFLDPESLRVDPKVARASRSGSMLILHRVLSRSLDPAGLLRGVLDEVHDRALGSPVRHACAIVSAEPISSEVHRQYLSRLRTRAINKVTQPDALLLAPHADPFLRPLLATDDSPLLYEPQPCGVHLDDLFSSAWPGSVCRTDARFGRADHLPLAPFPTLPKLAPRPGGSPADLWRTALFTPPQTD